LQHYKLKDLDKTLLNYSEVTNHKFIIDLKQTIFNLGFNCQITLPEIYIYKLIFPEAFNRQLFFDTLLGIVRIMALCDLKYKNLTYGLYR
jgi:hypothetical protein